MDTKHDRDGDTVRGPVRAGASGFEPLTAEGWTQTFYAASMDFGGGVPGSQPPNAGEPR